VIRLVTDSTSDLLAPRALALGVTVVPLTVRFGAEDFRDGIDLGAADFYARLTDSSVSPTTSQPSPQAFADAYRDALRSGDAVISVHISHKLSGTVQSATLGAREVDEARVHVADSGSASAGLQLIIEAARRDIDAGLDVAAVVAGIADRSSRTRIYVLLDTLVHLQRGGRIGRAQAAIGGMLKVKPLLCLRDGEVQPESKVRSRQQGIDALVGLAKGAGAVEAMAVMHADAPEHGERLRGRLREAFPGLDPALGELGPVVGTYTGSGALGVALMTAAG